MEKIKTIVDREPLSSSYIGSKQNFGHVLSQVKNLKPPVWKTFWFYGPVGLSAIAITVSVASINASGNYENGTTSIIAREDTDGTEMSIREDNVDSPKKAENTLSPTIKPSERNSAATKDKANPITVLKQQNNTENTHLEQNHTELRKNMFPHIKGVYTGNITIEKLCSEEGIQCNDEIRIISFTIQYSFGLQDRLSRVKGNKLPKNICDEIRSQQGTNMIFITEIMGLKESGEQISLTSLNYLATK